MEDFPFLRLYAGTIQNRMRGPSMHPIHIQETLNLSTCADNSNCQKNKLNIWVQFGRPTVFKAQRGKNLEQKAGTIHADGGGVWEWG